MSFVALYYVNVPIYSMSASMPSFGPYERPAADGAAQDDLNVAAAAAAAAGAAAGAVLGAAAVSMAPDDQLLLLHMKVSGKLWS